MSGPESEPVVERLKCDCYECLGESIIGYTDDGRTFVKNSVKYHTLGEPCGGCGRPKSEYRDLGRKGYYVCWYCDGEGYDETHST